MKAKKSVRKRKQTIVVKDLNARINPKGGASDIFAKIGDIKGESFRPSAGTLSTSLHFKYDIKGTKEG